MSELFRKSPLQNQAPSERYDKLVEVVSPRAWLFAAATGALLLAVFIWLSGLKIADGLSAPGIFMRGELLRLASTGGGRIAKVQVDEGQMVESGQLMLTLENPALKHEYDLALLRLEKIEQGMGESDGPGAAEPNLQFARRALTLAENRWRQATRLESHTAGKVLEIRCRPGSVVAAGTPLLVLEKGLPTEPVFGVAFLSAEHSRLLSAGMDCQISPLNQGRRHGPPLMGRVAHISPYPVSRERLALLLANPDLVERFSKQGPLVIARITFADTEPGLQAGSGSLFQLDFKTGERSVLNMVLAPSGQEQ